MSQGFFMQEEYGVYGEEVFIKAHIPEILLASKNLLYEVFRVEKGVILFQEDHLSRMNQSIGLMYKGLHFELEIFDKQLKRLLELNDFASGNIKLAFLVLQEKIHTACWYIPSQYPAASLYEEGIATATISIERSDPHIKQKSVNDEIREYIQQKNHKAVYETFLVNTECCITEGSRSNVFFVKDELLFSPPSDCILEGITRKKVIELARMEAIEYHEMPIRISELGSYQACFITGTSPKVLPVASIDQLTYRVDHPLVSKLSAGYDRLIQEYIQQKKPKQNT